MYLSCDQFERNNFADQFCIHISNDGPLLAGKNSKYIIISTLTVRRPNQMGGELRSDIVEIWWGCGFTKLWWPANVNIWTRDCLAKTFTNSGFVIFIYGLWLLVHFPHIHKMGASINGGSSWILQIFNLETHAFLYAFIWKHYRSSGLPSWLRLKFPSLKWCFQVCIDISKVIFISRPRNC